MIHSIGEIKKVRIDKKNLVGSGKKTKTRKNRLTKSVRKAINVIKKNTKRNEETTNRIDLQFANNIITDKTTLQIPKIPTKQPTNNNPTVEDKTNTTSFTYPRGILKGGKKFVPLRLVHKNKTRKRKFKVFKNEAEFKKTLKNISKKKKIATPTVKLIKLKNKKLHTSKTRKRKYTFDVAKHRKSLSNLSVPNKDMNKSKEKKREFLILNNIISPDSKMANIELLHDALKTDKNNFIITRE